MSAAPFDQLSLIKPILRALEEEGYTEPTPIQTKAIPLVLAERDLMATAQTGTGKTAAFAMPILQLLQGRKRKHRGLRALILTPTRELALQIEESLRAYGRHLPFSTVTVLGGVSDKPQIQALRRQPEILVGTPGRLLDLMSRGHVHYDGLEFLVLDEADRMLDMGFIHDVRRIIAALPSQRQSLLFSATLPREIAELASTMLRDPASVDVAPAAAVADNITQKVLYVKRQDKKDLLTELLRDKSISRALVFTRTKHRANRVAQQLTRKGISADAIHSNKSQGARQRALAAFDGGRTRVLVATDIMARGIDVEDISHVINFELPNEPESYVHRIGRTARAGAAGTALSFCNAEEVPYLEDIEKLTRVQLTLMDDHAYHAPAIAALRGNGNGGAATARSHSSTAGGNGNGRGNGRATGRNGSGQGNGRASGRNGSGGQGSAGNGSPRGKTRASRRGRSGSASGERAPVGPAEAAAPRAAVQVAGEGSARAPEAVTYGRRSRRDAGRRR